MHIVYVTREYPPTRRGGGIASYVRDMAEAMSEIGHKVTVVCASDDTRLSSDVTKGLLRVIRLSGGDFVVDGIEKKSFLNKMRPIHRFHSYRKKIRKIIDSISDIDVIEVAEFGAEAYYLLSCACPVVIRLHTPTMLDRKTFSFRRFNLKKMHEFYCAHYERLILQNSKYITSCSNSLAEWINKHYMISREKISVIYNPIKVELWSGGVERFRNCRTLSILFVGTVAEEKGVGTLIRGCEKLVKNGFRLRLTVAGKMGKYGENIKKYADDQQLSWCQFLGNINREKLLDIYSSHDIACFPSFWDNLPIVCLEAMCAGCITIGSSSGGMSEIITSGKDGFLLPPRDEERLKDLILFISNLSDLELNNIRENALEKVKEKFAIDKILAQMESYYKEVIGC